MKCVIAFIGLALSACGAQDATEHNAASIAETNASEPAPSINAQMASQDSDMFALKDRIAAVLGGCHVAGTTLQFRDYDGRFFVALPETAKNAAGTLQCIQKSVTEKQVPVVVTRADADSLSIERLGTLPQKQSQ